MRLLGFVRIFEGLGNGFPLKLLSVELVSGVLELGIGLVEIGEGDLFPDTAIEANQPTNPDMPIRSKKEMSRERVIHK